MAVSVSLSAPSPSAIEKVSGFFGREAELAWIRRLWDEASTRDRSGKFAGPRLAILIAETGLGKSRLVQQLYDVLANDPVWNPPDKKYWPDTIVSDTRQIHENPPLVDDGPNGPPRFLWLGARWQPIDSRNVEERTCIIPALRDALYVHVRIAQRHRSTWQRLRTSAEKNIKSEGPDMVVDKMLDLTGIPYASFGLKLVRGVVSARNAPTTVGEAIQKQQEDAVDTLLGEMREVFGGLGGGGLVLPTVLWLDDAHWIDPMTLRFLHRLWKEATEKRWPLLIAITHWENEWNNLRREAGGESLLDLAAQPGAEKLVLSKAPVENIAARLRQRLPGLSSAQHASMLDKAAGNFLTLEENIGELIGDPENFVDLRVEGPLTHAGEDLVATWASDRQRRIQERFMAMKPKPTLQQLLAWASRIGIRFPQDVPTNFAALRQSGSQLDRHQLLESCMDPYAVLGAPSPNLREFRDRAYHAVATEYFQKHRAQTDEAELLTALRNALIDLISGAFDSGGQYYKDPLVAKEQTGGRFNNFTNEEKRVVLEIALRELPIPSPPDWANTNHRAALRAVLIYLDTAREECLWTLASKGAQRLRDVRWENVPAGIVSAEFLARIAQALNMAAAADIAVPMLERALTLTDVPINAHEKLDSETITRIHGKFIALSWLGQAYLDKHSFEAAKQTAIRMLEIAAPIGEDSLFTTNALKLLADVFYELGEFDKAEVLLARGHAILVRILGPDHFGTIDWENQQARVYSALNRYPDAEKLLRRVLKFRIDSGSDKQSIGYAADLLGVVLAGQSLYNDAEKYHRLGLTLREQSLGPRHPMVANSLHNLAWTLIHKEGGAVEAESLLRRSLEIEEQANGPFSPELVLALDSLVKFYRSQKDEARALPLAIRALAIKEKVFGPDHPGLAEGLLNEGRALVRQGRLEEAEPLFLSAMSIMERQKTSNLAFVYTDLARLCKDQGRLAEAEGFYKRALGIFYQLKSDPLMTAASLMNLGTFYLDLHDYNQAYVVLVEAFKLKAGVLGTEHSEVLDLFNVLRALKPDE